LPSRLQAYRPPILHLPVIAKPEELPFLLRELLRLLPCHHKNLKQHTKNACACL
jgi:hypothetical protein